MNEELNYDVGDCSSLSLELDPGSSPLPSRIFRFWILEPLYFPLLFIHLSYVCLCFLGSIIHLTSTIQSTFCQVEIPVLKWFVMNILQKEMSNRRMTQKITIPYHEKITEWLL